MGNSSEYIKQRLRERNNLLSFIYNDDDFFQSIQSATNKIIDCYCRGGKIITAGNGGSAAQSQHFIAELMGKMKQYREPIAAISLNSDISVLTCIANDFGFERVFSRQLEGIATSKDLFIAFTTSGKSRNILEALQVCDIRGVPSLVVTGKANDTIKKLCNSIIELPSTDTALIQEIQLIITHIICEAIEQIVSDSKTYKNSWNAVVDLGTKGYQYLILDRDGVINNTKANSYISNIEEFSFTEGFLSNIVKLSNTYKRIFIATNQRGVGKGYMTKGDLDKIHFWMLERIKSMGGRIDKIYTSIGVDSSDILRKPNIGMAKQIQHDYPEVQFEKTVVVGDSFSDRLFADNINAKYIHL